MVEQWQSTEGSELNGTKQRGFMHRCLSPAGERLVLNAGRLLCHRRHLVNTWMWSGFKERPFLSPLANNGCHVNQSNRGFLAVSPGERVPPQAGGELSTSLIHRRRPLNLHGNHTLLHCANTRFSPISTCNFLELYSFIVTQLPPRDSNSGSRVFHLHF